MQMLHVFHEIHDGGLGARVQGQDSIDNVLRGVVQGHIAVQNLRRAAVFRAPQQVVSGPPVFRRVAISFWPKPFSFRRFANVSPISLMDCSLPLFAP